MKTSFWIGFLVSVLAVFAAGAAVDIEPYQNLIQQGKAEEAMTLLARELEGHPGNARLLYDYGVAAYAAKRYDEALLAFDKVEASRNESLIEKARAQKGNAEFRLGMEARTSNLDETVERWKTSLAHYRGALKADRQNTLARNNHDLVEKLLMDLLLKSAQKHMQNAHQSWMKGDGKIEELRAALEKFQEATRVDEKNEPAQQGEKQARQELAQELATSGEKQAQRKPDQPLERAVREIEKGVNKLEDANRLLPEDKPIEQKLDQARRNLADALTELAKQEIDQSRKSNWDNEKFNILDEAVQNAQKALDQIPEHQEAQRAMELAKQELAQLHAKRGDQEARESEHASLRDAVNKLESALEDYKDSNALKENSEVMAKAARTEQRLEDTLQKLADKMMEDKPKESLEEKAARLETAQQALQDLEQLNPSERTERRLDEVGERLADVRQELARQTPHPQPRPPQQGEQKTPQQPPQNAQNQAQADFERMPHLKQQPMGKGDFKSDQMSKNARDY